MSSRAHVLAVALLLATGAGCRGDRTSASQTGSATGSAAQVSASAAAPPGPASRMQGILAKMREIETTLCACRDADCATEIMNVWGQWIDEEAKKHPEPLVVNESERQARTTLGAHLAECAQRATAGAGSQGTAP